MSLIAADVSWSMARLMFLRRATGHSWVVKRIWDVDVYQEGSKND